MLAYPQIEIHQREMIRDLRQKIFNKDSGQVFHESYAPAIRAEDRRWTFNGSRYSASPKPRKEVRIRGSKMQDIQGVQSLQDLALQSALNNLHLMDRQSIVGLPQPYIEKLWDEILERQADRAVSYSKCGLTSHTEN